MSLFPWHIPTHRTQTQGLPLTQEPCHAVHLFNAMPAFTHREPGVVGAVFDSKHVFAELICDGVHIHPSMVRAAFAHDGGERICLISDSMRATGMPDGTYTLGGLDVNVSGKHATLAEGGALAGSVTNLADCMRTARKGNGDSSGRRHPLRNPLIRHAHCIWIICMEALLQERSEIWFF